MSEFLVGAGARLSLTMVHNWAGGSAVRVEEGGCFVSDYVALRPVRSLQTGPFVRLGPGASARLTSVVYAHPGSDLDVGGRVVLEGPGASAEVVNRAVAAGGSVTARGRLEGRVPGVRAHLECSSLILAEGGHVVAIPELEALCPDLELSHEAAVGRLAPEGLDDLMARGLREDAATSLLVRGFLDAGLEHVGPALQGELERLFRDRGGL